MNKFETISFDATPIHHIPEDGRYLVIEDIENPLEHLYYKFVKRGRWGSYNGIGLFYPYPDQSNLPFTHYKKVEE